jgi:hypothetical protein
MTRTITGHTYDAGGRLILLLSDGTELPYASLTLAHCAELGIDVDWSDSPLGLD